MYGVIAEISLKNWQEIVKAGSVLVVRAGSPAVTTELCDNVRQVVGSDH